jgi:UDP-glucose 4-epimerase
MDEACRALQHLIELPEHRLETPLYNVGGEWPVTILEVAETVRDRCEVLLGFRPELTAPSPGPGEETQALDYRLDALRATGFVPSPNREQEIDRLLQYCQTE